MLCSETWPMTVECEQQMRKADNRMLRRSEIQGRAEKTNKSGRYHRLHEKEQAALVWTCGQKGGVRLGEENFECLGSKWYLRLSCEDAVNQNGEAK